MNTLCFCFLGFSSKSEMEVTVIHIHRKFRNCNWGKLFRRSSSRKPCLLKPEPVLRHPLFQVLYGDQANDSVTRYNPRPYCTTSGIWLKIYAATCIFSNSSVQYFHHKPRSMLCPTVSTPSAAAQWWYHWPHIY